MTGETRPVKESPIACDMSAIEPGLRAAHVATGGRVFRAAEEIREFPDGYAFRLTGDAGTLSRVAEFIALKRLCCPFLGFALEVEPEGGPVWLRLTGREGVKAFIREEVGELLGGANLPMSSEAIPGSLLSPIGSVRASFPSAPLFGAMPKWMKLSQ
ncbi:MAG TPA: hypothetical protein VGX48_25090 [Pyrinomonadaceae bacterium]|nr:hypothetical protein [Pyrinomonadaceae bacterium]